MTDATLTEPVRPRRVRRRLIVAVVILLPLAIHAVWDQIESTLLAREIAAIARRGEPVNVTSDRFTLTDPEERQAASLYAAAAQLARWQAQADGHNMARKDIEDPTTDPRLDYPALAAYLAQSEPALHLLNVATPLRFVRFGAIAPDLIMNQSSLDALNGMNCLNADILSVRGEGDVATDLLVRSVRLQRAIQGPFYRYLSVRHLYGSLRVLLRHTTPGSDALTRLQSALEEWPDEDGMVADVLRHRALTLADFWPYPPERSSWSLRPKEPRFLNVSTSVAFVALRPFITHELRTALRPYDEVLAVARQPWPAKLDAARNLQQRYSADLERAGHWRTLGFVRVPSVIALYSLGELSWAGTNLAMRRTAIATMALERYRRDHGGAPPSSLQALVPGYLPAVPEDPFSGRPLLLKADGDGYVIYSVDLDRTDDGGLLDGAGTGKKERRRAFGDTGHGDIGIRVPLAPKH